ncbi:hypothetical protein PRIPAC_78700 [Pristionchus pacificus]|nr:hypothetical protein PRIPAC_78700 [Pristionchus pacificus]
MIERRRIKEEEFMKTCPHKCLVKHPSEKIYAVDAYTRAEINLIDVAETLTFFENSFPSLRNIPKSEKERLFKDYNYKLNLIVNYYLTKKIWGEINKKFMTSVIVCYDDEIPFDFYYPEDDGNKHSFKCAFLSFCKEHVAMFTPLFKRSQIKVTEFHALAALAVTESDLTMSEDTHHIMDSIRSEIFENLQSYYQNEMSLTDFSIRLGNLMSINHTIQECQVLYNVIIPYFSTFFDTYMTEKLVKSMTLD